MFREVDGQDEFMTLWQSHSMRLHQILHGFAEELKAIDRVFWTAERLMEEVRRLRDFQVYRIGL